VVNFDVPAQSEDYIHRVGRTARAEMTGEAFTFAAPDEADDLRAIERAIGKALPRVTLPDFDYSAKPAAKLEIPISERIAKIRAQRAEERSRAREKEARRADDTPPAPAARENDGARRKRRRRRPGSGPGHPRRA
jgi:ATP-dependent RNA helicase RhlE